MYIDVFEGGFLSALAVRAHYSVAVGCLWGCSQAENRASETGRDYRPSGRVDCWPKKVANLKGPPALLSPRGIRKNKRRLRERVRNRDRRTPDFEQAIILLRNVYNEIIVSGSFLRLRVMVCLDESFLYYRFLFDQGFRRRLPAARLLWTEMMFHTCRFSKVPDKMTKYG